MKHYKTILIGEFHWDVETRILYKAKNDKNLLGKNTITLTPKQHRLLLCLYSAAPKVLQRHEIIDFVWESKPTSPESLPQLINRTRIVLEDDNKDILINEPSVGYSLNFKVQDEQQKISDEVTLPNCVKPESIEDTEATPISLKVKLVAPVMLILTIFNLSSAIKASYCKQQFMSAFFAESYPHVKQVDNNNISIVIEDNECNYTKNSQLLKCQ